MKPISIVILFGAIWFSLSVASVSGDMPFEDRLESSFLGSSIIDADICTDSLNDLQNNTDTNSTNSTDSGEECQDYAHLDMLKWYHPMYGFFGIVALSGSLIVIGLGIRMMLWLIWILT